MPLQHNAQLDYISAIAVTPNDGADLPAAPSRGLMVTAAGTGTLTIVTAGGDTLALTGVTLNMIIPISTQRVKATGTTATVVALY
jgi:hypothetical protein